MRFTEAKRSALKKMLKVVFVINTWHGVVVVYICPSSNHLTNHFNFPLAFISSQDLALIWSCASSFPQILTCSVFNLKSNFGLLGVCFYFTRFAKRAVSMRWKARKYQAECLGRGGVASAFTDEVSSSINNCRRKSKAGPASPGMPNGIVLNQSQSDSSSCGGR